MAKAIYIKFSVKAKAYLNRATDEPTSDEPSGILSISDEAYSKALKAVGCDATNPSNVGRSAMAN